MLAPIVTLKRDQAPGLKTWVIVVKCPHCPKTHNHGGGDALIPYLGHRSADCGEGSDYELVLDEDTIVNSGTGPERMGGFDGWVQEDPGPRSNPRLSDLYDLWDASKAARARDAGGQA